MKSLPSQGKKYTDAKHTGTVTRTYKRLSYRYFIYWVHRHWDLHFHFPIRSMVEGKMTIDEALERIKTTAAAPSDGSHEMWKTIINLCKTCQLAIHQRNAYAYALRVYGAENEDSLQKDDNSLCAALAGKLVPIRVSDD